MHVPSVRPRALMFAILLAVAPTAAFAQPQAVAGTRVTLQPPQGFVAAERFPGFANAESGASIMVTEVPAAFSAVTAGFTREQMAPRGMTLRESHAQTVEGRPALLLAITQTANGITFDKWILAFGDDSTAVLVTGTYPQASADRLGEPIRQAVLSARRSAGPLDPFDGLGFRITEGPRLRIAKRMSNMLMLNEGGTPGNLASGAPMLVVGSSLGEVDLSNVEAFARRRLTQIDSTLRMSNVSGGPVTIDGAPGWELFADAPESQVWEPTRIYQVVLAEGSHYILVQGFVGPERAADFIPEFQAVARSLRRTR